MDTTTTPRYTLNASDHRAGAYGDSYAHTVDTMEAAHTGAMETECGLYSITDNTTGTTTTWEWDGVSAPYMVDTEVSDAETAAQFGTAEELAVIALPARKVGEFLNIFTGAARIELSDSEYENLTGKPAAELELSSTLQWFGATLSYTGSNLITAI